MRKMKIRKLLQRLGALALTAAMILALLPAGVVPVTAATGDSASDPIELTNENFASVFKGTLTKHYKLTENIVLTGEWTPVTKLSGSLDGNGYSISGVKIGSSTTPSTTAAWAGLIKELSGGTVKNLTVNVEYYTAPTAATNFMGGIVGKLTSGTVENCVVNGTMSMTVENKSGQVGGVVGMMAQGSVIGCSSNAEVLVTGTGTSDSGYNLQVGGIVGRITVADKATVTVANCYNASSITVTSDLKKSTTYRDAVVGGIVGQAQFAAVAGNTNASKMRFLNCANVGALTAKSNDSANGALITGGIVGNLIGALATNTTNQCEIKNCYNAGTLTGKKNRGDAGFNSLNAASNARSYDVAKLYCLPGQTRMDATNTVAMSASDMKAQAFADTLNENARNIEGAQGWALVPDDYPKLTGAAPVVTTPELKVTGTLKFGETLTASVENVTGDVTYQWYHAGATDDDPDVAISGATAATYTLQASDVGKTVVCTVTGGSLTSTLREVVGVAARAAGPAAPSGLAPVDASSQTASNGKITRTDTTMEYSTSSAFIGALQCTGTEVTGLVPGIYYVRVAQTATHEAGATAEVVVGPYVQKWTAEGNYTAAALSGTGTEADPYLITSAADLAKLAVSFRTAGATSGKYFKVTAAEIDLSAYEWVPITNFAGHFDGNGVKIKGLKIGTATAPAEYAAAGLFGTLNPGATVTDVTADVAIHVRWSTEGTVVVGGIAGYSRGTVDGCTVIGTVNVEAQGTETKLDSYVGGIVGRARVQANTDTVAISNCVNHAAITVTNSNFYNNGTRFSNAGGIVGYMHSSNNLTATAVLVNCVNTGHISALGAVTNRNAGGIAGNFGNAEATAYPFTLHNCYSTGTVTAAKAGNLVGSMTATNAGSLYYSATSGTAANNVDTAYGKELTADELKAADLLQTLNINACTLNERLGSAVARKWIAGTDGNPVPYGDPATDKALTVTLNSNRYGSVKVEVQMAGETTWNEYPLSTLLPEGCTVKLTFTPANGCLLDSVTANGEAVENISENTYTFTVTKSTEIAVVYKAGPSVNADPIYVNPNATTSGDGKSPETAYKTLKEAVNHLTNLLTTQINSNVTVYLMEGRYELEDVLILGEAQTSLGRVTFKNYNGGTPVITSGKQISGFTKVSGKEYYSYQLPDSAKEGGKFPQFRDILVNGERATLARTQDYIFTKSYKNEVITGSKVTAADNTVYIDPLAAAAITNENLNGVEIVSLVEWKSQLFQIINIRHSSNGDLTEIDLNEEQFAALMGYDMTKKSLSGRAYWLQNHLSFLDEPGEFWYDQTNGVIYYYPYADQNMQTATVEYATLDKLIDIQKGANFTFDGISFTGTTTAGFVNEHGLVAELGATYYTYSGDPCTNVPCAAIWADGSEGLEILNCKFHDLAGHGFLSNYGTKDLKVTGNVFRNLGMSGIIVGVNQRQWNEAGLLGASERVTITNNYVTNVGIDVPCAPAIKVARSRDLKINHNTIIHASYSAIMAGWGWNVNTSSASHNTNLTNAEIAYNYIEDFIYAINDGGAIYTCGANDFTTNADYFNTVHHNYIRGGAHNKTNIGIYHDGSSSNFHTHHNFIDDIKSTHGPIFFQDHVESQNSHNILVDNNFTTVSPITTSAKAERNIVLKDNTVFAHRGEISAEAKAIMDDAGLEDAYKHIAEPMDSALQVADDTIRYTYEQYQQGKTEAHVKITNNSDITKTFTLSLADRIHDNFTCSFSGNDVELAPGQSAIITITFTAVDETAIVDTGDAVIGFLITDSTGRSVKYPRAITFLAEQESGAFELEDGSRILAYGTPKLDGILDEDYKNSYRISYGTVFHPTTNSLSDVTGYAYLLWDEQYLYLYAYVEDPQVMSIGKEKLDEGNVNTIWATDALEAYLYTDLRTDKGPNSLTKFAVDAFGITRFGNALPDLAYHNALPYFTAFTYNGQIIEGYEIKNPTAGQTAGTVEQPVNGYVIEMAMPLTEVSSIDGTPTVGDQIKFYIQNNDLQPAITGSGTNIVAKKNVEATYTLVKNSTYTVTWKNEDGTVLETDDVKQGALPTYDGATPTKTGDGKHITYTFKGWDKEIVAATADVTYTAQFTQQVSDCADANKDHKCDLCGKVLSECTDADKDHKCDLCGKVLSECTDADKDHKCDLCGKVLGECTDADKDHKCDLCGKVLGECADADKDHKCDLCGKVLGECADADKDHKCDRCGKVLSECTDADKDHKCDLCGKVLEDENSKTGDSSKIMLASLCLLASLAGLVVLFIGEKKRKQFIA